MGGDERQVGRPPSEAREGPDHSRRPRAAAPGAGLRTPTRWQPSSRRPTNCSLRSMPTATCRPRSRST